MLTSFLLRHFLIEIKTTLDGNLFPLARLLSGVKNLQGTDK